MKLFMTEDDFDFLRQILGKVDEKAYDAVYDDVRDRIDPSSDDESCKEFVALEESEIYTILDAIEDYIDNFEEVDEEEKERAAEIREDIGEQTGLFV